MVYLHVNSVLIINMRHIVSVAGNAVAFVRLSVSNSDL